MDYKSFGRAMDRAGKALFLDNDTERCMKIMQSIIIKFDSVRKCGPKCPPISGEECPPIAQRVACFSGRFCPGATIAVHVSMARFWAAAGEVKPLFTTLKQLLVVSFFWRLQRQMPVTPPNSPSAEAETVAIPPSALRLQLPAEIWGEIASWLSRPGWKTLLHVPHPIRKFASNLFFRDIFLQFDVYSYLAGDKKLNEHLEELEAWHSQRALEIMTRLMRDWRFACRVRSLRVHMCDRRPSGPVDVINFELSCLAETLCRLTKLKTLHLYGSPMFLCNLVLRLPQLAPHLEGVTIRYHRHDGRMFCPRIPAPLGRLGQLALHPTGDISAYNDAFEQVRRTLRTLRMTQHSNPLPLIVPLVGNLTRLELLSPWGGPDETSLFQVILSNGERLESLRLVGCPNQVHSIYFRQYPRSLPLLRDFGVRLVHGYTSVIDPDLFPAICDFLRDRPLLEALELIGYAREIDQAVYGFDVRVWEFISTLRRLRVLSANLLHAIPDHRMTELIPRSVKTLSVPPCGLWYLERLLLKNGWPDDLRFFGYDEHFLQSDTSLARRIATGVPSVRVVRLAREYFSVTGREDSKLVRMEQWPPRAAGVFRKEYLENCGCEDYEYLYVDHDDAVSS